jgi:two-component system LytT family response regulator
MIKCTVVDDEPYALKLLQGYVEKTPFLSLNQSFTNPFKALEFLQVGDTDLVFLDINMPELSGLQLLKSIIAPPRVIFTTAYPQFGAESYEYNAIDYLVKPVSYDRFLKAVSKAAHLFTDQELNTDPNTIFVKSGTQIHQISINNIHYIEAAGNYMTFFFEDKKVMAHMSFQDVQDLLPTQLFERIHKSYIVSIKHIRIIEKHRVMIGDRSIPIGVTYRENFLKRFEVK